MLPNHRRLLHTEACKEHRHICGTAEVNGHQVPMTNTKETRWFVAVNIEPCHSCRLKAQMTQNQYRLGWKQGLGWKLIRAGRTKAEKPSHGFGKNQRRFPVLLHSKLLIFSQNNIEGLLKFAIWNASRPRGQPMLICLGSQRRIWPPLPT